MKRFDRWFGAALLLALAGCSGNNNTTPDAGPTVAVADVLKNYSDHLYAAYGDSVTDAQALSDAIDAFLANPTDDTLTAARTAWIASRAHYMLTEGGRFYDGPIDVDPPNHEALINSWPLDESYIDYATLADGGIDDTVGLINHPDVLPDPITVDAIDALNAQGGDDNISDGYHAAEFLLWGQALQPVGPGQRSSADYAAGGPRPNVARRAAYLKAVMQGILTHLNAVHDAWAPGATYRAGFEDGGTLSVALALTGLGKMSKGELAGERIDAPYTSKKRGDQHDCFSSLTLVDYSRDAQGLEEMYLGIYNGAAGPSLSDLVRQVAPEVDAKLRATLQQSVVDIENIPPPFELAIQGNDDDPGRTAIRAAVADLRSQGDQCADAASALGLSITIPDEN